MNTRKTGIVLNIFISLGVFLLSIIVIDTILRFALAPYLYYREQERFEKRMPEYPDFLLRYDALVEYEGEVFGDLAATSGNVEFKQPRKIRFATDKKGFRNKRNQHQAKNKIIMLGDSFGVGTGTDQDSSCAGLLARKFPVYNLSFPGNPLQELANLMLEYDQIEHAENPLVLWLIFTGNDLPNSIINYQHQYIEVLARNELQNKKAGFGLRVRTIIKNYLRKSPIWKLSIQAFSKRNTQVFLKELNDGKKMYFYQNYIDASLLSKEEIMRQPEFADWKEVFRIGKEYAMDKKIDLKVVLIPTKYEIYDWVVKDSAPWQGQYDSSGFSRTLASTLTELEVDFFDSKPFLLEYAKKAYSEGRNLWWLDDTHLNSEGHQALSEFIETKVLATEFAAPTGGGN